MIASSIQGLKKRNDAIETNNATHRRNFEAYKAVHP